jgi:hypothetical protein
VYEIYRLLRAETLGGRENEYRIMTAYVVWIGFVNKLFVYLKEVSVAVNCKEFM